MTTWKHPPPTPARRINGPIIIIVAALFVLALLVAAYAVTSVVQMIDQDALQAFFAPRHPMHPKGY